MSKVWPAQAPGRPHRSEALHLFVGQGGGRARERAVVVLLQQNYGILELLGLEKASKIVWSDCAPTTSITH